MPFRKDVEKLVERLKADDGSNLASVIFYGSATLADEPLRSDIHLLISFHAIDAERLTKISAAVTDWMQDGYPAPVLFTVDELRTGSDVFPIEFNHMKTARKVLHGDDVLAEISITDSNLRHQVEFELRSKVMRLRRFVIESSASPTELAALMINSVPSFISTLRAAVMVKTGVSHVERLKVIEGASAAFGLDGTVFGKILDLRNREGEIKTTEGEVSALFESYLTEIDKMIKSVNNL